MLSREATEARALFFRLCRSSRMPGPNSIHQTSDSANAAFGRALVSEKNISRPRAHRTGLFCFQQKSGEFCCQRGSTGLNERIDLSEIRNDLTEVFGVRPDHDWFSKRSGFYDVVSAAWNETAADENNCCELIDRCKLADRVQQYHVVRFLGRHDAVR